MSFFAPQGRLQDCASRNCYLGVHASVFSAVHASVFSAEGTLSHRLTNVVQVGSSTSCSCLPPSSCLESAQCGSPPSSLLLCCPCSPRPPTCSSRTGVEMPLRQRMQQSPLIACTLQAATCSGINKMVNRKRLAWNSSKLREPIG